MQPASDNPFWDFSLAAYHRPGVAQACLALQDRSGLDVNLLLFCCWAGSQGWHLDFAALARLAAAVGDWQRSVVSPLRAARRHLKELPDETSSQAGALRRSVKDCELAAERIEQDLLHDASLGLRGKPCQGDAAADCAAANLKSYLALSGVPMQADARSDLESILSGVFQITLEKTSIAL